MRALFDHECFGYIHDDKSFEALPMPLEWKGQPYGRQIERSRSSRGYRCEPIYIDGATTPGFSEIGRECAEFNKRWRQNEKGDQEHDQPAGMCAVHYPVFGVAGESGGAAEPVAVEQVVSPMEPAPSPWTDGTYVFYALVTGLVFMLLWSGLTG